MPYFRTETCAGSMLLQRKLIPGAIIGIGVLGCLATIPLSGAQAQSPGSKDRLYATSSPAKGSCPNMDWHIVVHSDKTVNGLVSWDASQHIVHLTGTMDDHGAIKLKAAGTGPNKADTVTGTLDGNVLTARISGTGTPCDNETMSVPRAEDATPKA
jgi:hypothetical protein